MNVEYLLAELRKELDAIEAAILSLERVNSPDNPRPNRPLDFPARSRTHGANGFHRNPASEQSS
jgi:hypothetical protein